MKKLLVLSVLCITLLATSYTNGKVYAAIEESVAGISTVLDRVDPIEVKSAFNIVKWTTARVNLRKEASMNSDIIITLDKRTKVEVRKTSDKWTEVSCGDVIGFVYSDYLTDKEFRPLEFTDKEIDLLAKIVWLESRGESDQGSAGVVIVVLNRIASKAFSDTMLEVLSDKGEFSTWKLLDTAKPTEREYEIIEEVLHGDYDGLLTDDTVYFSTEPRNNNITAHIGGHYFCAD